MSEPDAACFRALFEHTNDAVAEVVDDRLILRAVLFGGDD